jgi:hypothetical protein
MKSKIKTFKDACKSEGIDPNKKPDVSMLDKKLQKHLLAMWQLIIITAAINREETGKPWKPDWDNSMEYKYYPWFWMDKSGGGFRFGDTYYVYANSRTGVGSRLCFITRERALYAVKTFIKLYKDIMV